VNKNLIKDKIQRECLNIWYKAGCKGTLELPTGVGKSRTGVLAIEYIFKIIESPKILILTPTQIIRDDGWKDEFKKWGLNKLYKNIETSCIQTACKLEGNSYDLVVADEIHNYIPVEEGYVYYKFFENNNIDRLLGLSASIEEDLLPKLNLIAPIVYTMSINKAVDLGLVSPFKVFNIPVELTMFEQLDYEDADKLFKKTFSIFEHDLKLMFTCLKNKKTFRQHLLSYFNMTNASPDEKASLFQQYDSYAYVCNKAMRDRKSILYNAANKLTIVKNLSDLFKDKKGLVFSETAEFADQVQKLIGDTCVSEHSKVKPPSKRKKNIAKFQDGRTKVNRISTVRSLNEGANLKGVEFIIVASGTSKLKSFLQRTGRSIRFEDGKNATVIRLFVKGSQEEKWMRSSQEGYFVTDMNSWKDVIPHIEKRNRQNP